MSERCSVIVAGSEDGTVRVWELRSRQAVRVIAAPDKAPVTGLLVLDRPPTLASGLGRHGAASSSDPGHPSCHLSYINIISPPALFW